MRLGFPIKVYGRSNLRSHDGRRWQNNPHLSVSLAYVRDLFLYLDAQNIRMYRLSADLAPYVAHPNLPQFHHQIDECRRELEAVGALARELGIRLSFHAGAHVLLNTPEPRRLARAQATLQALTSLLDAMGLDDEAVVVLHVGGHYHDRGEALALFARRFEALPAAVRARLALEHDDRRFGVEDCLWLHRQVGVRVVFDLLHHQLYNPTGIDEVEALQRCLATWPPQQTPKIHVSTPATEMVRDRQGRPHPPRLNRHSHYVNPFPVIAFLRRLPEWCNFDMMLEAKACDLAVIQFRRHLAAFAPDLVARFQICPA
ncbi:MAG: UV DNA damage repair endonuclease UvsE [Caldilineae bacterium]|nr:MAG: UV DNA damage repair endonuclease UvsE [Caldilineae bacterium]